MKSLTFIRSPMKDSPEAVIDYLEAQGCTPPFRDVHMGPDGSFRGSGTRTSIEDMAAYEVIEDGEGPAQVIDLMEALRDALKPERKERP